MPEDLRSYFETVDGMGDGGYDDYFNRFWSLNEVAPVGDVIADKRFDQPPHADHFIFADHSLHLFFWAVQLDSQPTETSGPIFVVSDFDGTEKVAYEVAPSFTRFIDIYLADRGKVF